MATKYQVKSILAGKFEEFSKLFSDDKILSSIKGKFYISGGCIASLLMNEEPNDYDIYFFDRESLNIATTYILANKKELVAFESKNAITLKNKFQIIIKFNGHPEKMMGIFDFCHCCCYYHKPSDVLFMHESALESIATKNLIYKGTEYPVGTMFRIRKFYARGWEISKGNWFKIILDINKLSLDNPHVLREQISGIYDAQYLDMIPHGQKIDIETLISLMDQSDVSVRLTVNTQPNQNKDY